MPLLLHPYLCQWQRLPAINQSGISAGDSFSPQIVRFCPFSRCRVSAGAFDLISGSRPILQASAITHGADADGRIINSGTGFTSMEKLINKSGMGVNFEQQLR
ncbi:hypothetical protein [Escherichia coli]|uniref:hypothetical protein n=1 Tax=Escherichia coli TaxID=562 RepID=UPI00389020FE